MVLRRIDPSRLRPTTRRIDLRRLRGERVEFLRLEYTDEFEGLKRGITAALKRSGYYDPDLDDLVVDQLCRAVIHAKQAEAYFDGARGPDEAAAATDMIQKHRAAVRQSLELLAANRRERMRGKAMSRVREELDAFFARIAQRD